MLFILYFLLIYVYYLYAQPNLGDSHVLVLQYRYHYFIRLSPSAARTVRRAGNAGLIVHFSDCGFLEPVDLVAHAAVDDQLVEVISSHEVRESLSLAEAIHGIV